jgi:replicative DNA helicase
MKNLRRPNPPSRDSQTVQFADQIHNQIFQRAYELYEQRGRDDGHDLDDWLTAESEVTGRRKAEAA